MACCVWMYVGLIGFANRVISIASEDLKLISFRKKEKKITLKEKREKKNDEKFNTKLLEIII